MDLALEGDATKRSAAVSRGSWWGPWPWASSASSRVSEGLAGASRRAVADVEPVVGKAFAESLGFPRLIAAVATAAS